jgi:hypothetical protein
MRISANIIGAVIIISFFSVAAGHQYNVSIPSILWSWVVTAGHQLGTDTLDIKQSELKATGNIRFLENAKSLLAEDLSEIKNMFSKPRGDKNSTPYAPPEKVDANTMPPEKSISAETNSATQHPDSMNPPPTKKPELVGAL